MDIKERFAKRKEEFKKRFDIDLEWETFLKIEQEENRASEVQKEAESVQGSAQECEESNAKCVECSAGLSYLEHSFYGNRCVFCASLALQIKNNSWGPGAPSRVNLFVFLLRSACDYIIYCKLAEILKKKGTEGRVYLCGCLGYLGFRDINQVKKVSDKLNLIRELSTIIKKH